MEAFYVMALLYYIIHGQFGWILFLGIGEFKSDRFSALGWAKYNGFQRFCKKNKDFFHLIFEA
jgi:hypothetical protein